MYIKKSIHTEGYCWHRLLHKCGHKEINLYTNKYTISMLN